MNQFLNTKSEIIQWLDSMEIENYSIKPNDKHRFIVNVSGNVWLCGFKLRHIPVQFHSVNGNFNCSYNMLSTLKGCPQIVDGNFDCGDNKLTNLEHSPQTVGEDFICDYNNLVDLLGCPQNVGRNFNCQYTCLTSLEFCPERVERDFLCAFNHLKSLEFCPKFVGEAFYCKYNKQLGDVQNINDFDQIYKIHQETVKIKNEKK